MKEITNGEKCIEKVGKDEVKENNEKYKEIEGKEKIEKLEIDRNDEKEERIDKKNEKKEK